MLQKFKITSCAFFLCLFGLTLMTVSPVFAEVVAPREALPSPTALEVADPVFVGRCIDVVSRQLLPLTYNDYCPPGAVVAPTANENRGEALPSPTALEVAN